MLIQTALRFDQLADLADQGAGGRVFYARDHQLQATLVVKQVKKASLDADRYFLEAARLYALRHPHIAQVLYASQDQEHVYLAMPPYECSLEAVLRLRPLTVREIVRVGTGFLSGLHHVHLQGLVHFDVKPSNILLTASGGAALADFGLSMAVDPAGRATPLRHYESHVAPEYVSISPVLSQAADIYQAGLTLYRMCVGSLLWRRQLQVFQDALSDDWESAVAAGEFPLRAGLPAHISPRLQTLICRAISVDPDERHPTVHALLNDLAAVDECLDWQFGVTTDGVAVWELNDSVDCRRIEMRVEGKHAAVAASRTSAASGKTVTLHKHGTSGVTVAQGMRHVRSVIEALTKA